jgi:hypothetical protein
MKQLSYIGFTKKALRCVRATAPPCGTQRNWADPHFQCLRNTKEAPMFGRTVSIDGREIFVFCTPQTPYSEICRRAMWQLERDEEIEAARSPQRIAYKAAVDAPWRSPQAIVEPSDGN